LEFLSEYDFDIKHIKGKENKVVDSLNGRVHEFHATNISMYQFDLKYIILDAAKSDLQYMKLMEKLQQVFCNRKSRTTSWEMMKLSCTEEEFMYQILKN
jgi:hypothetical protein